jgi:hypothetical protein
VGVHAIRGEGTVEQEGGDSMIRTFDKRYRGDHPMFADSSMICKLCGGGYTEDEPPNEGLKGYCSEECEFRDRMIDEAEKRREEKE